MKITGKQFNKILDKLKVTTSHEEEKIRFYFDNDYFAVEGYYNIGSDTVEDLEVYIEDVEIEITGEQLNKLVDKAKIKVVELEYMKREYIQLLKCKEVGF